MLSLDVLKCRTVADKPQKYRSQCSTYYVSRINWGNIVAKIDLASRVG